MLGLSSTPEPFLENIGRELDEAYRRTADRWRQNAAVRIEVAGGREELVLTGLDGLEDPPSLVELRTLTERMLPQVDLPELLLEVNAWTGFADAFTHVSETRSRIPDLPTSVCAALIADACNIALDPLVRKDTPAQAVPDIQQADLPGAGGREHPPPAKGAGRGCHAAAPVAGFCVGTSGHELAPRRAG